MLNGKKDSPSWQQNPLSKTSNESSKDKPCVKTGRSNWIFKSTARKVCLCPDWQSCQQYCHNLWKVLCHCHFKRIGILDAGNETYEKIDKNQEEIIQDNVEYNRRLKLSNGSKDKSLPIIYWIPKLHKNPVGSRFIKASTNYSTKPLSKAVSQLYLNLFTLK